MKLNFVPLFVVCLLSTANSLAAGSSWVCYDTEANQVASLYGPGGGGDPIRGAACLSSKFLDDKCFDGTAVIDITPSTITISGRGIRFFESGEWFLQFSKVAKDDNLGFETLPEPLHKELELKPKAKLSVFRVTELSLGGVSTKIRNLHGELYCVNNGV